MPKTYERASESITALIAECMDRWHPQLKAVGLRVDCLVENNMDEEEGARPSLKLHGYPAAATVQVVPLKRRALGEGDVLITIDGYTWDHTLGERERIACIDHELHHIVIVAEEPDLDVVPMGRGKTKLVRPPRPEGGWVVEWNAQSRTTTRPAKLDDLMRPKCRLKLHDWELGGFKAIAERHGQAALEVQMFKACWDKHGQGLLFGEADPLAVQVDVPKSIGRTGKAKRLTRDAAEAAP